MASKGGLYASENDPATSPAAGRRETHSAFARRSLTQLLDRQTALAGIAAALHDHSSTPEHAAPTIDRIVAEDPHDPFAHTMFAAAVLVPTRRFDEARRALLRALDDHRVPRRFEAWIEPYCRAYLAIIDLEQGFLERAQRGFDEALGKKGVAAEIVQPYVARVR